MTRDLDDMTDAELAEWQYAHREQLDAEEGEPVDVDFAPQVSVTMSFRLAGAEADAIRAAADKAGMSLSEWIRQACAAAADPAAEIDTRRALERELATAERQVERAREALAAARSVSRAPR